MPRMDTASLSLANPVGSGIGGFLPSQGTSSKDEVKREVPKFQSDPPGRRQETSDTY